MVEEFLKTKGRKIICGGTTAQVFARESGRELEASDVGELSDEVPPISRVNGIGLVTEGIITMNYCSKLLKENPSSTISMPINGATMLLQELLSADRITIFFGTQVNEAYEQIKPGIRLRSTVIETLAAQLQQLGKEIIIHRY